MNFLDPENPAHADLPLLPSLRERLFAFFENHFSNAIGQIGEFDIAVAYVNMMSAIVRHKYPSFNILQFSILNLFLYIYMTECRYVFLHSKNSDSIDLREVYNISSVDRGSNIFTIESERYCWRVFEEEVGDKIGFSRNYNTSGQILGFQTCFPYTSEVSRAATRSHSHK